MNKILNNKKGGTTIMIALMIMMTILTVSLSLGNVVVNGLKTSKNQANATQAYFAAESGAEEYLWEVRKNSFDPIALGCSSGELITNDFSSCGGAITTFNLGGGTTFYIKYDYSAPTTTISNFGEYKDTRRAVRLMY